MKRAGIPISIIVGLAIIVGLSLYGVMTGFVGPNKAAASTQSLSTVSPSPEDCPKLKSQFAVPKTQCTPDNVKPRPLDEVSPLGAQGACWPAGQFTSPAEASDWLKSGQGQPRAEQYSTWFSNHKDYYRYTGANGNDFASYVTNLVRVKLPYDIRVQNTYCDANGVKLWQVQVLPKGKYVYFEAGYQPGNKQHHDIRPAAIELCGNPLLPPPPPAPPTTVTLKTGKPTPSHPGTSTTPPGGCTQPKDCPAPKDPNAGAGHKGNVEPGHLGTNPPITEGPKPPAGTPPATYSPPAAPPARQSTRPTPPAPEPSNPTIAPSQTIPPCTPRCG